MQHNITTGNKTDEWMTPDFAVYPLLKYIDKSKKIWCPFDKQDSNFVKIFRENGNDVICTHIESGGDFFKSLADCDIIISNPPYSQRNKILERLYSIGKPFAMLLNFSGIYDSMERQSLFREYGHELMIFNKRINYIDSGGKHQKGVPFPSFYLCWSILQSQIVFEDIQ